MPLSPDTIAARLLTASLPALPGIADKLHLLARHGDASNRVLTDLIACDPALTALVIGQANAAGHATHRLSEAVVACGLGTVVTTARCALPVTGALEPLVRAAWAQANLVAHLVPELAAARGHRLRLGAAWDEEALRIAGLIHDLVHTLVAVHFPDCYARAAARCASEDLCLPRALADELGQGLPELAAQAARVWSLPEPLTAVLVHWWRPEEAGPHADACALVQVAHVIAQAIGYTAGAERCVLPFDDWALARLELRTGDLPALVERAFAIADDLAL